MSTILLQFTPATTYYREALSAVAPVGDTLWVAADEGAALVQLRKQPDGGFIQTTALDLVKTLDLPAKIPDDEGNLPEADIEGMDWEPGGGYLWLIGSHSLKRKKPEEDKITAKNLERLAKIEADGNRYVLGRVPLDGNGDPLASTSEHFAARLECDLFSSELLKAVREDDHFRRFLPGACEDARKQNVPGKDNGFDLEGLAVVDTNHLLIGLRGPVLRGWAVLLEIKVEATYVENATGRLTLEHFDDVGRRFRKIFLELDGLGVRDLCWEGNDLLILAGPTMALDWPPELFRWKNARGALGAGDQFVWQRSGALERLTLPVAVATTLGHDHAEGIAVLNQPGGDRLLVVFDSPSDQRLAVENAVSADLIPIP